MSNVIKSLKNQIEKSATQLKFENMLGKRQASQFLSSVVNTVSNDKNLQQCDSTSILSAAAFAASISLPVSKQLGFVYLVPYNSKNGKMAQFQIGYKGLLQLAYRSSQYKMINVLEIYEGQLISWNPLTEEFVYDKEAKKSDDIIGVVAVFELLCGLRKTVYWTTKEILDHAQKYSQSYRSGYGVWKDNRLSMMKKTVLKNLLEKWGVLSIEMQNAIKYDQAVPDESGNPEYVDNPKNNNVVDNLKKQFEDDNSDKDQEQEEEQEAEVVD